MPSNSDTVFDDVLDDVMQDERAAAARRFDDQVCGRSEPIDESDDLYMLNFSI